MFRASRYKRPEFAYPVYGRPADMLEVNLQDFDKSLPKKQLVGRLVGQKLVPYYTRKEINNPALHLRAPALLYVSTPIDSLLPRFRGRRLPFWMTAVIRGLLMRATTAGLLRG